MQSRPGELLAPDRARLFPRFETYRLKPLDPDTDVHAFPLPGQGATQSRVSYNSQQLGFREVRARIHWDHLDARDGRGVYVDTEWNVVAFELNVSVMDGSQHAALMTGQPRADVQGTRVPPCSHRVRCPCRGISARTTAERLDVGRLERHGIAVHPHRDGVYGAVRPGDRRRARSLPPLRCSRSWL